MNKSKNPVRLAAIATATALLMTACGTSHLSKIDDQGKSDDIVWPEIDKGGWMQEGTFPNLDNLRRINVGNTKDQLYDLIGRPHFKEGHMGVREWDYIFNFRTGGPNGEYITCQYKVLFDKDYLAQSFFWREPQCAALLAEKPAPAPVVVAPAPAPAPAPPPAPAVRRINLSADALFAFAKSGKADMLDKGRQEVIALSRELANNQDISVTVIGHTDLIGSDASNYALSRARAETIRQLMIENGVVPGVIRAIGAGESQPIKECDAKQPRTDYIKCLQPNRRVEIEIVGLRS